MRIVLSVLFLAGCASTPAPNAPTVASVGRETRLCLDRKSVQAGQRVHFKRRVCAYVPPKNLTRTCSDQPIETAEVLRAVDDRCVVVLTRGDGRIEPGDEIEIAFND
jgi:hypothetical protein